MSRAGLTGLLLAGLTALCLAACETEGPARPTAVAGPPPPPPPPAEYGAINGLGAFRTATGGHATCAGQSVAVMADTPRSRARMIALYGSTSHASAPISLIQSRAVKLGPSNEPVSSSLCGPDGRFSVTGLPAGGFFLIARVRLDRPDHSQEQLAIMQAVSLRPGETQQVRLAP